MICTFPIYKFHPKAYLSRLSDYHISQLLTNTLVALVGTKAQYYMYISHTYLAYLSRLSDYHISKHLLAVFVEIRTKQDNMP